jgi:hypothetical protein
MSNESIDPKVQGAGEADLDLEIEGTDPEDGDAGDGDAKNKGGDEKKPSETPEARSARLARMSDQHDKKYKLGKYSENDASKKTETPKSTTLDYGQKAFLIANGIKGAEETGLVQSIMESSGKSLDEVIESGYFKSELKSLREAKATESAIPKGTKRGSGNGVDSVEYWLAKGTLPSADQPELRQKVVNARIKAESNSNVFSSNPVVGN